MTDDKVRRLHILIKLFPVQIILDPHAVTLPGRIAGLHDDLIRDDAVLHRLLYGGQQPVKAFVICSKRYQYHQKIQPPYTAFGYTSSMLSHCTMNRSAIG